MKVLLDTNVVLDVLLNREQFALAAVHLLGRIERGEVSGVVCATTVTTVFYIAAKTVGREKAIDLLGTLLGLVDVTNVNRGTLLAALESKGPDFEDNVIIESARLSNVDVIVTRDQTGFRHATCHVMTPREFLATLDLMN